MRSGHDKATITDDRYVIPVKLTTSTIVPTQVDKNAR